MAMHQAHPITDGGPLPRARREAARLITALADVESAQHYGLATQAREQASSLAFRLSQLTEDIHQVMRELDPVGYALDASTPVAGYGPTAGWHWGACLHCGLRSVVPDTGPELCMAHADLADALVWHTGPVEVCQDPTCGRQHVTLAQATGQAVPA